MSPKAHERWHQFAAEEGVSVSALIEAISQDLEDPGSDVSTMRSRMVVAVASARRIDAERRRRGKS